MNKPHRRIAAHRLWTPQGVVEHPVVTLSPEGRIAALETAADPDRMAATEFRAGVLVPDFPADYRAAFAELLREGGSLAELLPARVPAPGGRWVVICGLDYAEMRLTEQSRIDLL